MITRFWKSIKFKLIASFFSLQSGLGPPLLRRVRALRHGRAHPQGAHEPAPGEQEAPVPEPGEAPGPGWVCLYSQGIYLFI